MMAAGNNKFRAEIFLLFLTFYLIGKHVYIPKSTHGSRFESKISKFCVVDIVKSKTEYFAQYALLSLSKLKEVHLGHVIGIEQG